jgi:hypothetical protein
MKLRLLGALVLVWLAIGFAVPGYAQQKDTVDPQIAQQIRVLASKHDEAVNKHDAAAVAALYTLAFYAILLRTPLIARKSFMEALLSGFQRIVCRSALLSNRWLNAEG